MKQECVHNIPKITISILKDLNMFGQNPLISQGYKQIKEILEKRNVLDLQKKDSDLDYVSYSIHCVISKKNVFHGETEIMVPDLPADVLKLALGWHNILVRLSEDGKASMTYKALKELIKANSKNHISTITIKGEVYISHYCENIRESAIKEICLESPDLQEIFNILKTFRPEKHGSVRYKEFFNQEIITSIMSKVPEKRLTDYKEKLKEFAKTSPLTNTESLFPWLDAK